MRLVMKRECLECRRGGDISCKMPLTGAIEVLKIIVGLHINGVR